MIYLTIKIAKKIAKFHVLILGKGEMKLIDTAFMSK